MWSHLYRVVVPPGINKCEAGTFVPIGATAWYKCPLTEACQASSSLPGTNTPICTGPKIYDTNEKSVHGQMLDSLVMYVTCILLIQFCLFTFVWIFRYIKKIRETKYRKHQICERPISKWKYRFPSLNIIRCMGYKWKDEILYTT
jgi:hypothetical protein